MIDPFTAIGLTTNIVHLIEVGVKVVGTAHELTASGTTKAYEELKSISAETTAVCAEVQSQLGPPKPTGARGVGEKRKHDERTRAQRKKGTFGGERVSEGESDLEDDETTDGDEDSKAPHQDFDRFLDQDGKDIFPSLPPVANERAQFKSQEGIRSLAGKTRDVAEELSAYLKGLSLNAEQQIQHASKPRHERGFNAAKLTVKGMGKKATVENMRKSLKALQQGMVLRLLAAQSTSLLQLNAKIDQSFRQDSVKATKRSATFQRILAKLQSHSAIAGATKQQREDFLALLASLDEQTRLILDCRRVLKTLVFEEVHSREDAIPVAHAETFSWIFDKDRTDFARWLSAGSGTFWITGKPGSGKSTLMKYVVQHPETLRRLQQWSKNDNLVMAFHYFWNAGTAMQKSQVGLLRTLLIRIIQQCPKTALQCVPVRFRNHDDLAKVMPWRHSELIDAIRSFAAQLRSGTYVCIFIDGLDEYEGEHTELIDMISSISRGPCIKACVASRPWNDFTRAYHHRADGELEVQKLTEHDIRSYIADKMATDNSFRALREHNPSGCDKLMDDISGKAQGVFLWVHLVVRSLLRGLGNGDDLKILRRRLDSYPDTLDMYFDRMLKRIEDVYRKESSRLLLVAMSAERALPFWAPRCLELETEDEDYADAVETPPSSRDASVVYGCDCARDEKHFSSAMDATRARAAFHRHSDEDSVNHNCYYLFGRDNQFTSVQRARLRKYLDARCADLLEVVTDGIVFVHRTARDFLVQGGLSLSFHRRAGRGYDIDRSLARLRMVGEKRDRWYASLVEEAAAAPGGFGELAGSSESGVQHAFPLLEGQSCENGSWLDDDESALDEDEQDAIERGRRGRSRIVQLEQYDSSFEDFWESADRFVKDLGGMGS